MQGRYRKSKDQPHPFYITVLLLGVLPGMLGLILVAEQTFITIDGCFHLVFLIGLAAFGLHWLLRERLQRHIGELVAYCFLGWGPLLGFAVLFLNLNLYGHEQKKLYPLLPYTERYKAEKEPGNRHLPFIAPQYEGFGYMFEDVCGYKASQARARNQTATQVEVHTAKGIFGYEILIGTHCR